MNEYLKIYENKFLLVDKLQEIRTSTNILWQLEQSKNIKSLVQFENSEFDNIPFNLYKCNCYSKFTELKSDLVRGTVINVHHTGNRSIILNSFK